MWQANKSSASGLLTGIEKAEKIFELFSGRTCNKNNFKPIGKSTYLEKFQVIQQAVNKSRKSGQRSSDTKTPYGKIVPPTQEENAKRVID